MPIVQLGLLAPVQIKNSAQEQVHKEITDYISNKTTIAALWELPVELYLQTRAAC